jgi:hypothetical protein
MKFTKNILLAAALASFNVGSASGATVLTDGFNNGAITDNWEANTTTASGQWSITQTTGRTIAGNPFGYGGQPTAPQAGTGQAQFSNGWSGTGYSASIKDTTGYAFTVGQTVSLNFFMSGRNGADDGTLDLTVALIDVATDAVINSFGTFSATDNDNSWQSKTTADYTIVTAGTYGVRFSTVAEGGDRTTYLDSVSYNVVPEPSTALLGGLGVLALLRRRRA